MLYKTTNVSIITGPIPDFFGGGCMNS